MSNRRRFLGTLAAGFAAVPLSRAEAKVGSPVSSDYDLKWLDALGGVHRQVFDTGAVGEGLLRVPMNWLNSFNTVYGLRDNQLTAVVGLASKGFPANASDAVWAKYSIGKVYNINDPVTGAPATRNTLVHIAREDNAYAWRVPALVDRGVIFWQCDNALRGIAARLASAASMTSDAVYAELRAGLLPHVKLVPAHTMLVGLCQERGCTYEAVF